MNLPKLITMFQSEDACRFALEDLRWPDGPQCTRCESRDATPIKGRGKYDCRSCGYHFSVRAGTVLQDSKLPLWKWFLATYLMVDAKKGVSSNQLGRQLGISYKSAWYLTHRIRAAMVAVERAQLEGIIEADETFVGGKQRYHRRDELGIIPGPDPDKPKTIVLGALERGGHVRLRVGPARDRKSLHGFLNENVADSAIAIYTDDWRAYSGIGDKNTTHETVNHSAKEWVRGDVHSNGIESVWSLFKRSIVGSYHQLSVKHLDAYLAEMEWRFNNRDNPHLFRDTLQVLVSSDPLTFEALTTDQTPP